jgi:hypothetical protein
MTRLASLALITYGYRPDAKKVLDGSIVEREFVLCLIVCNAWHR